MHHGFIALPLQGLCKISAEQLLPRSGAAPVRRLGEARSVERADGEGVERFKRIKPGVGVLKPMDANGMETTSHYCSFSPSILVFKNV